MPRSLYLRIFYEREVVKRVARLRICWRYLVPSLHSLVFRDLPWTAVEKIHALATNETRRRKRRITPECCNVRQRPQTMLRYLSLAVVKGIESMQGLCCENEGVGDELVMRPPEPGTEAEGCHLPSNGAVLKS